MHGRLLTWASVSAAALALGFASSAHAAATVLCDGTTYRITITPGAPATTTVSASGANVTVNGTAENCPSFNNIVITGDGDANTLTYSGNVGGTVTANLAGGDDMFTASGNQAVTLNGEGGADTLTGGNGGDTLNGDDGVDQLAGGDGADQLNGGADGDVLTGGNGADELNGDAGNDQLTGGANADDVDGGADDDEVVEDGSGGNTLAGGAGGTDTLTYAGVAAGVTVVLGAAASGFEHVIGGNGADDLTGDAGDQTIDGGPGADELNGGGGTDALNGGDAVDTIFGDATAGDTLDGGDGDDIVTYADQTLPVTVVLDGSGGTDSATSFKRAIGGSGADQLTGDTLANTLDGGAGNDELHGGGGIDTLNGEGDSDTIHGDAASGDTLTGGGSGTDIVTYAGESAAVSVLFPGGGTDSVAGFERAVGGDGADTMTGDAADQELDGGPGNDQISGDSGIDTLKGEADDDTITGDGTVGDALDGGTGSDILTYAPVVTAVTVKLGVAAGGGGDEALGFEHLIGGGAGDTLTGTGGDEQIDGGAGDDIIDGGGGTDALNGGANDDKISGDGTNGDQLNGDAGTNTLTYEGVTTAVTVNLGGAGSDDTISNFVHVVGGDAGDTLTGSAGGDTLDGGPGNDVLAGDAGADLLNGGDNDDELRGGADVDEVNGDAGADTIFDDAVAGDTLTGGNGGGDDTLTYADETSPVTVNPGGPGTDATSKFEHVIGGHGNDILTGDSSSDRLEGREGNDTIAGDDVLAGTGGEDTLEGGDGADEIRGDDDPGDMLDGGGTGGDVDTLTYAGITSAVIVDLAGGGGSDAASNFEHVVGGNAGDTLTGDGGSQTIDGGPGGDELHGGGGNDTLLGNANADTVFGDGVPGDTLDGGTGADILTYADVTAAAVTVNLGAGASDDAAASFEHVIGGDLGDTLTGSTDPETIDGGPGADHLFGDAGADALNGGGGADELTGDADVDTLHGDAGDDTIFEDAALGDHVFGDADTDTLSYAGVPGAVTVNLAGGGFDDPTSIEHVVGGDAGDLLTGDANDQRIDGGPGTDLIDGAGGQDELNGDGDGDAITGDAVAGDTLTGGSGAGDDVLDYSAVATPVTVNLLGGVSDDVASGFETVKGGANDDDITGDASVNHLFGANGNDTLAGAGGSDDIHGDNGSDTASYAERGTAVDVSLAAPVEDTFDSIENLLGSSGDDTLAGDGNVNTVRGGPGSDTIIGGTDLGDTLMGGTGANDALTYAGAATPIVINFGGLGPAGTDIASEFEQGVGGDAADTLIGGAGPDILRGGNGADTLTGNGGADTINGDSDDDTVFGQADAGDTLAGGAGHDLLTYEPEAAPVVVDLTGSAFPTSTDAASAFEDVLGGSGNDAIAGNDAANVLSGGPGADAVSYGSRGASVTVTLDGKANDGAGGGAEGDNVIAENAVGGSGGDRLEGSQGVNTLSGLGGNDVVIGKGGDDALDGGAGTDTVSYEDRGPGQGVTVTLAGSGGGPGETDTVTGFERLLGGAGADSLTGSDGPDDIAGAAGADAIAGAAGNDTLAGDDGSDTLWGGEGSDGLIGGAGNDHLDGEGGADAFDAGSGDDSVSAFDGNPEAVACGDGSDEVDYDLTDSFPAADCETKVLLGYVPPPFTLDPRARDRDRDGSFAGTDCNDFDAGIRPGGPDLPGDGIDQNCDGRDAAFPPITTEFRLSFDKASNGTRVKVFELRRVPAGAKVFVSCKSKKSPRCVFASRTTTLKSQRAKFSIRGYFGDRPLSKGTIIQVRVSAGSSLGRSIKVEMRKPSQKPTVKRGCLGLDAKTAVACP